MKGKNTHLLFCTSGILLRRLLSDRNLNGVTHIFVDEIHERGMNEGSFLIDNLISVIALKKYLRRLMLSALVCVFLRLLIDCAKGSASTASGFKVGFNECHLEC